MTPAQLKTLCGSTTKAALYCDPLNAAMAEFGIVDPREQCMFLAQCLHETCDLVFTQEIASGNAYDTGRLAKALGNTPEKDGDGQLYKGRGLIQITGRENYRRCGRALGVDLIAAPERLLGSVMACRSAAWFWKYHSLGVKAVPYNEAAMISVTKVINGGTNGLSERLRRWAKVRRVLGV